MENEWGLHGHFDLATARIRFINKLEIQPKGCWLWRGAVSSHGYGSVGVAGKNWLAHRLSMKLFRVDPGDMDVLHSCDNPLCVNPDHLFLGTHQDNMLDKEKKGRGGHPYGAAHGRAKITNEQALEILAALQDPRASIAQLARQFGVTKATISYIKLGKGWKHLPRDILLK